jgi:hypothetical protein
LANAIFATDGKCKYFLVSNERAFKTKNLNKKSAIKIFERGQIAESHFRIFSNSCAQPQVARLLIF